MRRRAAIALGFLLVVGAVVRAGYLVPPHMDSDQAVFGLQARHILLGEFPAFSWGYAYIGTFQSYLAAAAFWVFGASRLVLNAVPLVLALLFILVTYALGRELAGERVGLVAALLVALAPPYLALHGAWARHGYMDTLLLGSVILLLALRLAHGRPEAAAELRGFALLGVVGGIAWWINVLSLLYLLPAALLILLHDPRALKRRGPWVALVFFLLGGAPFWLWNLQNAFGTFRLFRGGEAGGSALQLVRVVAEGLPAIVGARPSHSRLSYLPGLSEALVVAYGVALVWLVWRQVAVRLVRGGRRTADPGGDLLVLFLAASVLFLGLSRYGEVITAEKTKRYLLPLYSTLPVVYALFVARVRERSRAVFAALLALALGLHAYGNLVSYPIVKGEVAPFHQARAADLALFGFLKAGGLTRVYVTDYWLGPRLTFDAGEEIVFTLPVGERYPPYVRLVNAAPRVAYLFALDGAGPFEAQLRGLGATFERTLVGPYEVFHGFRPPLGFESLTSLRTRGWGATASSVATPPALAFDRDVDSSWYSGEPQRPGLFFQLDLGRPALVGKVTLLPPRPSVGRPRGYRVEVSRDGERWEETAAVDPAGLSLDWAAGQPRLATAGRVVSAFTPRELRYVRVHQTGSDPRWWWAVGELFVYGVAADSAGGAAGAAAAHFHRGVAYEARDRVGPAVREYWRATRLEPELERAHARLAALYERAGIPLEGAAPPATRALAFEKLGLWAKAAREYEKEIRRNARDVDQAGLHERLRRAYREAGADAEPVSTR